MNKIAVLWRAFLLLWTVLCGIFLFGVVRTFLANDLGFPYLGIAISLGIWAGGICLAWGVGRLIGRYWRP